MRELQESTSAAASGQDAWGVHQTVMAAQAAQALVTRAQGVYVDATFGRGGHTRELLARLGPQARVFGLDRDPQAAQAAAALTDARFRFVQAPFSQLTAVLADWQVSAVDGVLLDLGISSPQIDQPHRGFSLRAAGPLDMRMDPSAGLSLGQWLAQASVGELAEVIREYGEERFARQVAEAIVARRESGHAVADTAELAALVANTVRARSRGRKDAAQHPATRTFQALRIFINQELEELALVLPQILSLLNAGGRMAVIAFHSLEDRIVKRFIEAQAHPERAIDRAVPLRADQLPAPRLVDLGKQVADAREVAVNARARSAVLRVAQRTAAPASGAGV